MDIGGLKPLTTEVRIKHPGDGKYMGLTITLNSTDSEPVKEYARKVTDRRLKLAQRNKNFNAEEFEENGIRYLASAIVSWSWDTDDDGELGSFNGEQLAFTPSNAVKVLGIEWLRTQLDEALADTARFFPT